jgi:hypothetical protein
MLIVLPCLAEAQIASQRRFDAGVYAGGSFPLGLFTDSAKAGYHVAGAASVRVNGGLNVRIDVVFNKLSDKVLTEGVTFREVGTNVLAGSVGVELRNPGASERNRNTISPYLLAGGGAYRFHFDYVCRGAACTGPERNERSEMRWGLNTGLGTTVALKGITTFVQVTYHAIFPKAEKDGTATLFLASFGLMLPVNRR